MLSIGDTLFLRKDGGEDEIGTVESLDGDEPCFVRRPNGDIERWNVRSDEPHVFNNARVERAARRYKGRQPVL